MRIARAVTVALITSGRGRDCNCHPPKLAPICFVDCNDRFLLTVRAEIITALSFLSLLFWNSFLFPCEEFLVFLSVFPFFSRDFRVRRE